jgi:hypothetical protein
LVQLILCNKIKLKLFSVFLILTVNTIDLQMKNCQLLNESNPSLLFGLSFERIIQSLKKELESISFINLQFEIVSLSLSLLLLLSSFYVSFSFSNFISLFPSHFLTFSLCLSSSLSLSLSLYSLTFAHNAVTQVGKNTICTHAYYFCHVCLK